MKRFFYFPLLLLTILCFACSSSDDDEDEIDYLGEYPVYVRNDINMSNVDKDVTDGILYDVYTINQKGELHSYNLIGKKTSVGRTFHEYDKRNFFIVLLKIGKNEEEALKSNFLTVERTIGKIQPYWVLDSKVTTVVIDENTTFSRFKTSDINEIKKDIENIAASIEGK